MINSNQIRPICELLGNLTTGHKISTMFFELNIECSLDERDTKWRRLYDAVVMGFNKNNSLQTLINIIEWIMQPSLYVDNQITFNESRDDLNKRLSFIGLELLPTGKVIARSVATTLEEANKTVCRLKNDLVKFSIHPQILAFCRPEIIHEDLFHLIFEASKCLMEELRNLSGLNVDGNTLVNQCFDGKNPLIVMNRLSNSDEWSEHKGLQSLLNAIVYLYRNPKAHQLKHFSSETYQSTLEAMVIISRARYALEKCVRNNTR